jgi:hypothetical protein
LISWIYGWRSFWALRPDVLDYLELNEEYEHYEDEEDY